MEERLEGERNGGVDGGTEGKVDERLRKGERDELFKGEWGGLGGKGGRVVKSIRELGLKILI